jgi:hypothetical protein
MARIESRALAGYYPFPEHLLPALASLVSFGEERARWSPANVFEVADPCAGDGTAILGLLSAWRHWRNTATNEWTNRKASIAWRMPAFRLSAIELESRRFEALQTNVHTAQSNGVITTDSWPMVGDAGRWARQGTPRWCHLLYLNPPYDTHRIYKREEAAWLVEWLPRMIDGGLLIMVLPAVAVDACADLLAAHTRSCVFRKLPALDFETFRQLVVVAKISTAGVPQPDRAAKIRTLGEWPEDLLPDLEIEKTASVVVGRPVGTGMANSWIFRSVKPESVAPLLRPLERVRGVAVGVDEMVGQRVEVAMPPRAAHIVMALTAGSFDGQEIRSPRAGLPAVLVKANTRRQMVTTSSETRQNKDGEEEIVEKYTEVPELHLSILDLERFAFIEPRPGSLPTGAERLDQMTIADFVTAYGEPLAELMARLFDPLHEVRPAHLVALPPFKRQLFPAQHHAVSAALKLLTRSRAALEMAEIGTGKTTMSTQIAASLHPNRRHVVIAELERQGINSRGLPTVERAVVMCPPHLVATWRREILASVPDAAVVEVTSTHDFRAPADFYVISREKAKLGHGWRGVGEDLQMPLLPGPSTSGRLALSRSIPGRTECPKCAKIPAILGWKKRRPPTSEDFAEHRSRCHHDSMPDSALTRAVDALAVRIAKVWPTSAPGLWASQNHRGLATLLSLYTKRATVAANKSTRSKYGRDYDEDKDGPLNLAAIVPTVNGASTIWLGDTVPAVLGALGAALSTEHEVLSELDISEVSQVLRTLGGAATLSGISAARYATEIEVRVVARMSAKLTALKAKLAEVVDSRSENTTAGKAAKKLAEWIPKIRGYTQGTWAWHTDMTPSLAWLTAWSALIDAARKTSFAPKPCGEFLFCASPKPRRYSIAKWASRQLPDSWWRSTMLIIDEGHEMANGETAQSISAQRMAARAGSVLLLTGSLMSGYARSLFHVLRLANPAFRREWAYGDEGRFVAAYGFSRYKATFAAEKAPSKRGRQSDRRSSKDGNLQRVGDAPGVAPAAVLRHVLPAAAVVHQEDLELDIPPMFEHEVAVEIDPVGDAAMIEEWAAAEKALLEFMADNFALRRKLLWAVLKLPTYPDLGLEDVDRWVIQLKEDPDASPAIPKILVHEAGLMPATYLTPKERWLLDFAEKERALDRRSIAFVTHTGGGYPARLLRILRERDIKAAFLDVKRVPTATRDAWIEQHAQDVDVLICNPNAVRTGLNSLVVFNNCVWMEPDYDPRVYRQANGRIHRIGQREEANVYYLYIPHSSQAIAKELIAAKVGASLRVDGLEIEASLAMAGATDEERAAQAVYGDIGQAIYDRLTKKRV